jgi:hypothetical protein
MSVHSHVGPHLMAQSGAERSKAEWRLAKQLRGPDRNSVSCLAYALWSAARRMFAALFTCISYDDIQDV